MRSMISVDHPDALINGYDTKVIMDCNYSALREIIRGRQVVILSEKDLEYGVVADEKMKKELCLDNFSVADARFRIKDKNYGREDSCCLSGMFLGDRDEGDDHNYLVSKFEDNYKVLELGDKEIIDLLMDKKVIHQPYGYAEDNGNVEHLITENFLNHFFLLRKEKRFLLYDEFIDVRIFIRMINSKGSAHESLMPYDVRCLDINQKVLYWMHTNSLRYIEDNADKTDFTVDFSVESERLQAQYFLTRFHSNKLWNLDPTCIFCFRISAFVLPGFVPDNEAQEFTEGNIAVSYKDGERYKIDSIHVNSDICYDLSSIRDWIKWHFYDISLA